MKFLCDLIAERESEWQACEAELDARGTPLPLYHRVAWARANASSGVACSLVRIRNDKGACVAAFGVEGHRTNALPGHQTLTIRRLGIGSGGLESISLAAGLRTLSAHARAHSTILRVHVEVFALDIDARTHTGELLERNGFVRVQADRTYERTLVVDLTRTEEELLLGFHKNTRQAIRSLGRLPVTVRAAESVSLAGRLQQLSDETRGRTRGEPRSLDWESIIRLSTEAPNLSRISILERTDRTGSEAVIAFAWGCLHGNIAEYSESGSTRPDDLKVSTSYSLLWDLMKWARRNGAQVFDFGGITSGKTHSEDPLGGISDFKRRFSQQEREVGEEWQLEPHPRRAGAARLISRGVAILRRAASRIQGR